MSEWSVPDVLVRTIPAEQVVAYLRECGWVVGECTSRWWVLTGPTDYRGQPLELVVPGDEADPEYSRYVVMAYKMVEALRESPARPERLDDGELTVTDGPMTYIKAPPPGEPDTLHTGPSRAEVERLRARIAELEELLTDPVGLASMSFDGITLEAAFKHPIFEVIGQWFYQLLEMAEAPNYLEVTLHPADRDGNDHDIVLTAQRKQGKTPNELKMEAQTEAERLRALLRQWTHSYTRETLTGREPVIWECLECGAESRDSLDSIKHRDGCIVGDTLRELGND